MIHDINYSFGRAKKDDIISHLLICDNSFIPPLSSRVRVNEYAQKIFQYASCFEAWIEGRLIGLVAVYCNELNRDLAFITSVSVMVDWQGMGVASLLLKTCIAYVHQLGFKRIELELENSNRSAFVFYSKQGFVEVSSIGSLKRMALDLR